MKKVLSSLGGLATSAIVSLSLIMLVAGPAIALTLQQKIVLFKKKIISAPDSLTYETLVTESSGTSTATYSATLGVAATKRVIIVIPAARVASGNSNTVSSMTIGGNAASQVSGAAVTSPGGAGNMNSDIWYYADGGALGSSATIVVHWANANTRSGACIYNLVTNTPTASAGSENNDGGAQWTSLTEAISVPASGFGVVSITVQAAGTLGFSAGASLDVNGTLAGGINGLACGHTTSTGSVSVTGTQATAQFGVMSLGSWSP
jgi:hypothetical protein